MLQMAFDFLGFRLFHRIPISNLPSLFNIPMSLSVRLAKRVAEQIVCSRQTAEQYIAGAWVTVDQEVIQEPGFRVAPEQVVALLPGANLDPIAPVTILVHKPAGIDAKKSGKVLPLKLRHPVTVVVCVLSSATQAI